MIRWWSSLLAAALLGLPLVLDAACSGPEAMHPTGSGGAGPMTSASTGGAPSTGGQDAGSAVPDAGDAGLPCSSPVRSNEQIPQRHSTTVDDPLDTFANLSGEIQIQCGNCHQAPAQQGGFSYTGTAENLCTAHGNDLIPDSGTYKTPVYEMLTGEMPLGIGGQQALGLRLQAWIDQGCPTTTYRLPLAPADGGVESDAGAASDAGAIVTFRDVGDALTDLGSCVPDPVLIGQDPALDAKFAAMQSYNDLPVQLADTDMVSLDSTVLAPRGTVAYAPAYPLWTDDAKKLRLVHVPAGQTIRYDATANHFVIPPNTRFYKTFLKAVVESDGVTRYRKMETRIIVTREHTADAVFGTYVWNAAETAAQLLGSGLDPASPGTKETYLDGQPFPDYVRPYETNEIDGGLRSYAVPGKGRCLACHMGSENDSFVLGFTPYQINRRAKGEGGVFADDVLADELSQLDRLMAYGVVSGDTMSATPAAFPKLEDSALPREPRNDDELTMQAYMVGNCAHCHNPGGYAVSSNPSLLGLNMSPGGIVFQNHFDGVDSDGNPYFPIPTSTDEAIDGGVALAYAGVFRRVDLPTGAFDSSAFGLPPAPHGTDAFFNLHMPMHTPSLDCRLPVMVARWWGSVPRDYVKGVETPDDPTAIAHAQWVADVSEQIARQDCQPPPDIEWVLEDTTERYPYVPRNIDWTTGIDAWLRAQSVTQDHETLAKKVYQQGLFENHCQFPPDAQNPDAGSIPEPPWNVRSNGVSFYGPKSQIYAVNPGEQIFAGICGNCHGIHGDAQTGAARALRATSGARVASFVDGLFGPRSMPDANLGAFGDTMEGVDAGLPPLGSDGAAKYLVWMATGGTTVSFGRTAEEETVFFEAFVTQRAVHKVPLPVSATNLIDAFTSARANMLGVAQAVCNDVRNDASGYGALYDAAVASGDWSKIQIQGASPALGVPMWRDVCTLDNPITDAIRAATDPTVSPLSDWLRKATWNAGVMVYIYLRDELSPTGLVAAPIDACELKFPPQ